MIKLEKLARTIVLVVLALAMVMPLPAAALITNVSFPDVKQGAWYYSYVQKCAQYGIVSGNEKGYFDPNKPVTRGEFITMLANMVEGYTLTKPTGVHWAENAWNICREFGILEFNVSGHANSSGQLVQDDAPMFECTAASMNSRLTRYGMAVLVRNMLYNYRGEETVTVENPDKLITDYAAISSEYKSAVEQDYGKGILNGKTDASGKELGFAGNDTLTKAEAAKVVVCILWPSMRQKVGAAQESNVGITPTDSFSWRYRNMSAADRRIALFGDANKTYFTSANDAAGHMTTIKVNTWDIDKNGAKYTRTWSLTVNNVVVDEVTAIFAEIYADPSQFPIHSLGGARYTDNMRHSWGCAIDINPVENYWINYSTGATVGNFCYLNGSSPYCITPESIVVRTFAKYGWGWGGSGWTGSADYMHFSILSSGG